MVNGPLVLIGIGSNLGGARFASPRAACEAAVDALDQPDLRILARSRWYRTAPVPMSDQPWFVNGVVRAETMLDATALLARLHGIEAALGRQRVRRNEPRVIDLDLLIRGDEVLDGPDGPILPHPRLHERAFVLLPLAELVPDWRHPRSGRPLAELRASLPADQTAEPLLD